MEDAEILGLFWNRDEGASLPPESGTGRDCCGWQNGCWGAGRTRKSASATRI